MWTLPTNVQAILAFAAISLISLPAISQGKAEKDSGIHKVPAGLIRGLVMDDKYEPVPAASVMLKGTKNGTFTDIKGEFSLTVPNSNEAVLLVTSSGFKPQEFAVKGRKSITIVLKAGLRDLDSVVVIGYGTVKRKDLTGAVASVSAADLKDIPVNSAAQAITGRLAGVQVTTSEGMPGADAKVIVRGGGSITQDNSPLYVIDGIQVENGLTNLSPQDIQSIDVLKDASATAIYGARGANGVVLITTKGGKEGRTSVTYNGFAGINQLTQSLDVMNPYEFVMYQYERSRGNVNDEISFANSYGTYWDTLQVYKEVPGINWQDKMFGRNALMQSHNVGITGGNKATTYGLSLTRNDQEGIMLNSSLKRNLINFKLDHTANRKLKIGLTTRFAQADVEGSGTSAGGQTQTSRLRQTIKYKPLLNKTTLNIDDFDQAYYNETNAVGNGVFLINPIALNQAEYRNDGTSLLNIGGYVNYAIAKNISFNTTVGYEYSDRQADAFDDVNTPGSIFFGLGTPVVGVISTRRNTLNVSNVLNFSVSGLLPKMGRDHVLKALIGQEIYEVDIRQSNMQLRNFPAGITPEKALGMLNLGEMRPTFPASLSVKSRLFSLFTRANYSYKDKYLASFTLRADGSTKFAEDKRWGYFPSGSIAWRISREEWMPDFGFITDMKLRLSYGQSGNNRINDFLYTSNYVTNIFPYGLNNSLIPSYSVAQLANPDLRWERTISRNIGLDLDMFKNRVSLTVNAYLNDVKDLLINVPIPGSSGYSTQLQNVGSTRNKGLEFQLSANIIDHKSFNWKSSFNISFNRNRILALSTYQDQYFQNSGWGISGQLADYVVKVGDPVGAMYGYITDGFYGLDDFTYDPATKIYSLNEKVPNNIAAAGVPQPGSIKFKDLNGDGKVDADNDRTIIGNANAKFFGGLNNQFTYKNFDLSVFVNFVYGNSIMNANKIEFTNGYVRNNNMLDLMSDRWRTINASGEVIQSTTTVNGKQVAIGESPEVLAAVNGNARIWQPLKGTGAYSLHSWAVEDGSFLRINNITLGYTVPVKFAKGKIRSLRVYATVNNLAVLTGYSGYDPEVNVIQSTPVTPGVDYSAYPRSRTFLAGINLVL
jgi:TonB-linked SusC/RagA family outer membrane protein